MSKKVTCPVIYHGLCITAYGAINPCCASLDFVHIDDVESISEYFLNGRRILEARNKEFNKGFIPECITCQNKEQEGLISRKQKTQRWFPDATRKFSKRNVGKVLHMDIAFGNSCNQQCIMCSSNFSSQWLKWDLEFDKTNPWFRENRNTVTLKNWALSYDQLKDIASLVSNETRMIEIKGGEPLYDKRFEYFVTLVLEKNQNVKIQTNTNGSFFNKRTIDFLNTIPNFSIDVSLDGTGKTYEWIRRYSFDDIENNLSYALQNLKHEVIANYTTMKYNVDHYLKFYKWLEKLSNKYNRKIPTHFTQTVGTPRWMSTRFAEKDRIKNGIDQLLYIREDPSNFAYTSIYKERIDLLVNHLEKSLLYKPTEKELQQAKKVEELMEKVRGYSFDSNM
jgi:MoaA/NifB/PqqE/SkfB family radical SAM enzyme